MSVNVICKMQQGAQLGSYLTNAVLSLSPSHAKTVTIYRKGIGPRVYFRPTKMNSSRPPVPGPWELP